MQKENQPQTTINSMGRDAAAQISGEAKRKALEFVATKAAKIIPGLEKEALKNGECRADDDGGIEAHVYSRMPWIIASLTSPDRTTREKAKAEVREIVKLAEGE